MFMNAYPDDALPQVREVFEELGLKDEVLEETCTVVGASDETLLEFMKVLLTLLSAYHLFK